MVVICVSSLSVHSRRDYHVRPLDAVAQMLLRVHGAGLVDLDGLPECVLLLPTAWRDFAPVICYFKLVWQVK